jgi:Family of unknown function (DUF5684)
VSAALLASSGAGIGILVVVGIAVLVFEIAALWQVFVKAGQPGWAAIIPIYNIWILLKVIGRPGWWLALFLIGLIPFVGTIFVLVLSIIINLDLAKSFSKGTGFAVGLILLSFIFIPILGFGPATYAGPYAAGPRAVPA